MTVGNGTKPRKNTVKNTVRRDARGRVSGGNPGNSGGKPGRSGRLPNDYIELCREMVTSPEAYRSVQKIIKDDRHPHFASIYKLLGERGFGKPEQPITGKDGGAVAVRMVYDELNDDGDDT